VGFGTIAAVFIPTAERTAALAARLVSLPDNATCCGLAPPVSLMETAPLNVPRACGLKLTVIVQDAPAPKVAAQLLVCEKYFPEMLIPLMLRIWLPVLVNAAVWDGGGHVFGLM
jgi:hypothetical protein